MTVCVAARSGNFIFGASDRMLTGGDVEFEPDTAKIIPLTSSIAAMTAGDSALQSEILLELQKIVSARITAEPQNWLVIRDVAYMYAQIRNNIRRQRAEQAILLPLGLDCQSFVSRQSEMSEGFITKVSKELLNYSVASVSTIFTGVDSLGGHIYTVEDDSVRCHDSVGFAAIGSGYWHANSQLMLAKHNYESPVPDTLLLTYLAKRRAEVAPGVGKDTDMFMIGPTLGSYTRIHQTVLDQLNKTYNQILAEENENLERGRKEIQQYVERLQQSAEAAGQIQEQGQPKADGAGGDTTPNRGSVSADANKTDCEK